MARPKFPSDLQEQFMLRLPIGMRDRIKAAAATNARSMNAEIVATLNEVYPPEQSLSEMADEIRALVKEYGGDLEHRGLTKIRAALNDFAIQLDAVREIELDQKDD